MMKVLIINPVTLAAPVLVVFLVIEVVYSKIIDKKDIYKLKDFLASGIMGVGTMVITTFIRFASPVVIFYFFYKVSNIEIDGVYENLLGYNSFAWEWHIWLLCLILGDFSNYWYHRFNHTIRIFWAAHIVHHSSEHYNYGTALRLSWVAMFYKPLYYIWLPLIGFQPEMVVVCLGIEAVWQFALHSTFIPKLKFLEYFLITPKQHAVHHAKNKEYIDKNHGAIFNIWDRLFGTWKEYENDIDIQYGVVHPPNSYNPVTIITHEYKSIFRDVKKSKNLRQAFKYVFGPPGWSPKKE